VGQTSYPIRWPSDHLAAQFDADARSIELYAGSAVAAVIPVPPVIAAVVHVVGGVGYFFIQHEV
jgi:hypothetical protein